MKETDDCVDLFFLIKCVQVGGSGEGEKLENISVVCTELLGSMADVLGNLYSDMAESI